MQIAKAEKKHGDDVRTGESDTYSPEWRKYELEKAMIKYEDSQLNTIVYIRVRKKLLKAIVRDRKFMEKIYKK